MEVKGMFQKVVSGTKKFGKAAKDAGTSVKNNIGKSKWPNLPKIS